MNICFSFLLVIYLVVKLLSHMVAPCLTFEEPSDCFSKWPPPSWPVWLIWWERRTVTKRLWVWCLIPGQCACLGCGVHLQSECECEWEAASWCFFVTPRFLFLPSPLHSFLYINQWKKILRLGFKKKVTAPVYNSTSSVWGFQFLPILTHTCYFSFWL